jgi:predicted negative regulator of RcsB-dependent stress response
LASKRLTRKEIVHKDPIQIALEGTSSWMLKNRILLVSGLVIVCLAILAAYGWNSYSSSRLNEVQTAFAEGLELYHGTVAPSESEEIPAVPGQAEGEEAAAETPEITYDFKSDRERLEKSLESFQGTAEEYEGTKIGDLARYYTALCNIDLGEKEKASEILQGVIAESEYPYVRNLARNSAAQLASAGNDTTQAIALLEQIVEEPSDNFPVQFTLMNLAMLHEANGNTDKAIETYQRVATEFAETSSAAEAKTKINNLDPRGEKVSAAGETPAESLPVTQ